MKSNTFLPRNLIYTLALCMGENISYTKHPSMIPDPLKID